ncbi:dihydrouridine synthase [Achlya hypogyna]|uniref:tRNA-dihydrouridine(16/17) synthase [NAD(P)(+)] n=1 Tax=Achlya hypogyna TaxID=1202772 RepID=A0A1V9Z3B3_ACHHY|nr:dihydrouridine synthase [Achlya hypogyna]
MSTFWADVGQPRFVASPMVDQSEYAFRQLCRRYGAELCYTPMLHAKVLVSDATYRATRLDVVPGEGPTVVQLAGDDPKVLLAAAELVQEHAAAVDLNLGCPQPIARKGHYGSYLLREPDAIVAILQTWRQHLSVPATCKIRIVDEGSPDPQNRGLQATLRLVDQIEAAGAAALTVHGRNRVMSGKKTGAADWLAIAAIKQRTSLPIIANGNIETLNDVAACLAVTGADAVMSAEALLENPALFSGQSFDPCTLATEYLALAAASPFAEVNFHRVEKAHVVRILHAPMRQLARTAPALDTTSLLSGATCIDDLQHAVDLIAAADRGRPSAADSWYRRHRGPLADEPRSARKDIQRQWLAGGLRLTR